MSETKVVRELRKSMTCLLLEVHEDVQCDISKKAEAVIARVEELEQSREDDDLAYVAVVEVMQAAQAEVRKLEKVIGIYTKQSGELIAENERLREGLLDITVCERDWPVMTAIARATLKEKP